MKFLFKIEIAIFLFLVLAIGSAAVYMIPLDLIAKHDMDFSIISLSSTVFFFSFGLFLFFISVYALKKFTNSKFNLYHLSIFAPLGFLVVLQLIGPTNALYLFDIKFPSAREFLPSITSDLSTDLPRLNKLHEIIVNSFFYQISILALMIPIMLIYYYFFGYILRYFSPKIMDDLGE